MLQEVLQAVGLTEKNFAFDSAIFHHMSKFFGKRQSFSAAIRIFSSLSKNFGRRDDFLACNCKFHMICQTFDSFVYGTSKRENERESMREKEL